MNYPHKVIIQQRSMVRDSGGGMVQGWNDLATVWAKVSPSSKTSETVIGAQKGQETTYTVEMRPRGINSTQFRLVYKGRTLEIQSVINPGERNEKLVLTCIER